MTCFPESLQVPALGSADLQNLRNDLARKVADARSSGKAEQGTAEQTAQPVLATLTHTTNRAQTYSSSGSARVDLFFKNKSTKPPASPSCSPRPSQSISGQMEQLLHQAWQEDPADTLRLMAHLRDVRDGKGEQKLFHECATWLLKHHPLTLISNLLEVGKVGYWKDLLEIVVRQCVSAEVMQQRTQQAMANRLAFAGKKREGNTKLSKQGSKDAAWRDIPELKKMRKKSFRKHLKKLVTDEERQQAKAERAEQTAKKQQLIADFVANQKKTKKAGNAENAIKKIQEDDVFQLLHLTVAVLFAEQLQKDLEALKKDNKPAVSLAAKWAPTPARSHDKDTLMAARIAELLFPAGQHRSQDEAYNGYIARIKLMYHKQVLVPLRACLDVPEVYMSANAWSEVKYPRVPSVCMKNNKKAFEKHDEERFKEYLGEVRAGKKKIASGALKPHQLVKEAMRQVGLAAVAQYMVEEEEDEEEGEIAEHEQRPSALSLETMELQWKSYVSNLKASGTLSSALAVCDVSGSMSGEPMEVAIALSLLVAEVTAPPFNETVCTFSAQPQLHAIKEGSLVSKVADLQKMDWGMNTDLNAVFSRILERALASNIPAEQMIGTVFVFSDMQFDAATHGHGRFGMPACPETNFKVAQAEFEKHNYKLPKVVFWNLQGDDDDSMPVTHNEQGVALVSGFSGQLLKLFMAGASELEKFDAFNVMKEAIAAEQYQNWKVVD